MEIESLRERRIGNSRRLQPSREWHADSVADDPLLDASGAASNIEESSCAAANRRDRRFDVARRIAAFTLSPSLGRSGREDVSASGSMVVMPFEPDEIMRRRPDINSNAITPSAYTSARASAFPSKCHCSGAM